MASIAQSLGLRRIPTDYLRARVELSWLSRDAGAHLDATTQAISLDPANLPEYALRTTFRMLVAMVASLVFTPVYGTLAAKSRRASMVLVPILDILQSVPVLGYISFTVTFFLALFPGRVFGAELAAIFAIFTSQAWNMTFSFYQSLRTVLQLPIFFYDSLLIKNPFFLLTSLQD